MDHVAISSDDLLRALVEASAIDPIDRELARRALGRLGRDPEPVWALAIALAARVPRDGHTCLEIGPDFPGTPGKWARRNGEDIPEDLDRWTWPDPKTWADRLASCPLVRVVPAGDGKGPEDRPRSRSLLVLDRRGPTPRIYLERYWDAEQRLLALIDRLLAPTEPDGGSQKTNPPQRDLRPGGEEDLRVDLETLVPDEPGEEAMAGVREKRLALLQSVHRRLVILTGGPGTGKTTTISAWMAFWLRQAQRAGLPKGLPVRVLAMAPTGKAAARMAEAVRGWRDRFLARDDLPDEWRQVADQLPVEASTVHRALGYQPDDGRFTYRADNPLAADLVVVDEASMVDVLLMVRLLEALRPEARLLLVGDRDQLTSVGAGSVLGDLCRAGGSLRIGLSPDLRDRAVMVLGGRDGRLGLETSVLGPLQDSVAVLRHSFRFRDDSPLGRLVQAIQSLDDLQDGQEVDQAARSLIETLPTWPGSSGPRDLPTEGVWVLESEASPEPSPGRRDPEMASGVLALMTCRWERILEEALAPVREATNREAWEKAVVQALDHLSDFAVLCSHRRGRRGSDHLVVRIHRDLETRGVIEDGDFFPGQPLMVTANDYTLHLFNGDLGMVLPDGPGSRTLVACFPHREDPGFRTVVPMRIQAWQTAFAVTVHKAQGSEYRQVMVVAPTRDSEFLTREWVYTAVTRSRGPVLLAGPSEVFWRALCRRSRRASGLGEALWPQGAASGARTRK